MKDHVTDLETSKKLREAGIIGEHKSFWNYVKEWDKWELMDIGVDTGDKTSYPAYLLSELLDMVEGRQKSIANRGNSWACAINFRGKIRTFNSPCPIQAVSEAILWQKEQEK